MSGYIHIEHQIKFSGSETIGSKQNHEKMCLDNGSMVNTYLADNGVFKANHFVQHICENNQRICYCGVNENHESSVAELSICMVSEMYYAMMLHPSLLWKNIIGSKLWPMATSYSTYIYNHMPNA